MPQIKVSQVTEIDNPELHEIAVRVVKTIQLAAEKATAHQAEPATYPIASDPNSFEQLFLSRFQQLRPEQQQAAIGKVMAAIKAPEAERVRIYGDLAKVDLRSATAVEAQTKNLPLPNSLKFSQSETNSLLESRIQVLSRAEAGLTNKLELRIRKVKCVEDTNEIGKDEISLGGNTVDESGDTENISAFKVDSFSSGKEINYSPPRIFAAFDLLKNPSVQWPRSYFATLVLAETDWGGFPDFLNKFFEKVKQEVIAALTAALGSAIGGIIGSGIPVLGTTIGAVIGAVVGWVVGKVFDWFKSLWSDEIFVPITLRTDIPSLDARWDSKPESPQGEVWWKGHGGEYHLYYDWRIAVPPTGSIAQGDDMQPDEVLNPEQFISSTNGQYTFVYQGDGNLVLYRNNDGKTLWASNTGGSPAGVCIMHGDGNLVIYDPNVNPIWSSDTWQHPGSRLVVQDDGNVVIYRPDGTPVWATNTVQQMIAQGDDMQPDEVLNPEQFISSTNGQYTFVYQGDGNLVLYRNNDRKTLWASNTGGSPAGVCIMHGDGNLVIYDPNVNPIWSSDTWQHPGSRLVVQDDGNVVIYRPDGTPVWATNTLQ